jgi:hypothetical protein
LTRRLDREQVGGMKRQTAQVSFVLLPHAGQIADKETPLRQ